MCILLCTSMHCSNHRPSGAGVLALVLVAVEDYCYHHFFADAWPSFLPQSPTCRPFLRRLLFAVAPARIFSFEVDGDLLASRQWEIFLGLLGCWRDHLVHSVKHQASSPTSGLWSVESDRVSVSSFREPTCVCRFHHTMELGIPLSLVGSCRARLRTRSHLFHKASPATHAGTLREA